ncbi:MAG: NAD(P)/FAD-dependent oxidoreductase [Nitrospirales bacterium]|nr:NAD(P)/FAD-dependent oxidoreductase [Nitrospirales bacterium]
MPSDTDIAIIGAGAAGLAAGIFAAETNPNLSIALLDSAKTIGAKILVSGGGRCNVTNQRVTASDFHGNRKLIDRILRCFDEQATVRWFSSLGVPLKTEATGKLFPMSNKARTVLDGLLRRCETLGVLLLTHHLVRDITRDDKGFLIQHSQGTLRAKRVILATGGRSLPKTGSDGSGWGLAQQLGHTVTAPYPALVPLLLEPSFFHTTLSGISHDVTLTTTVAGKTSDRCTGSLLWTHFGISGPVVLDASRVWVRATAQGEAVRLHLHCLPHLSNQDVEKWLMQAASLPGRKLVPTLLGERLPTRVATRLADIQEPALSDTPVNLLSKEARRNLVRMLTNFELPVIGSRGWNFAEVTAGGVPLEEISARSMGSRHMPGLYVIGEMLDCDGRIGGFNFQWAWATGYLAGCHAALNIMTQPAAKDGE